MATVPSTLLPLDSLSVNVSTDPAGVESIVAGFIGSLNVTDTAVPVTMLLPLLVLVGVFVAPLLGFVERTVTACARLGNANPVKTAASGSAASHDCGFKVLLNLIIFFSSIELRQLLTLNQGIVFTQLRV
jgi:hypothetical protein